MKQLARRALLALASVLLALTPLTGRSSAPVALAAPVSGTERYVGWAMEAYPDLDAADFTSIFRRMRATGANLVWLGHSNPVGVDPAADEVGLAYPVYVAATNPSHPRHADALAIVAAQKRALAAARSAGLTVVLALGYRTQMGSEWSAAHHDSLRRGPDGTILDFGGLDASPYAGDFRADTARYYRWVADEIVAPYRDVITLLNLADEPSGVDYSAPAEATFRARVGYGFGDVGNESHRIAELGAFQSRVMVDFAAWAAGEWLGIDPTIPVTMSFDGAIGRNSQHGPPLAAIFGELPPNFQPSWDAYPRDGTAADKLNDSDLTALHIFLGTVGHLSARHQRPYWLWSSGNSWGLGQASADPSTIADAVVNLRALANVSRQAGGYLRGIAVWNYNQRGHGLYNDRHRTIYRPDDMFDRLSDSFPAARRILEGGAGPGPDTLVLAPAAMPNRLIGGSRLTDIWGFRGYNFGDLVSLARSGATVAVVETLAGQGTARTRLLIVLAREPEDLAEADVAAIRDYRASGRAVVAGEKVNRAHGFRAQWVWPGNAPELFFADDYTVKNVGPVAALGLPRLANSFTIVGPGEMIAYGGTSSDPAATMRAWLRLPFRVKGVHVGGDGRQQGEVEVGPGLVALRTQRRAYTVLTLAPVAPPAADGRYFVQTGFRVDDETIWDYFNRRGGVRTFGYPTSRTVTFLGMQTQFFQRQIVQIGPEGGARTLNLLDPELMPYTSFNGAEFPAFDGAFVATAPPPGSPDYASAIVAWTRAQAPDTWQDRPVGFSRTFLSTVSLADAFPRGGGSPAMVPLLNLEMWGVPTSQPTLDPRNHDFAYQRFQRGIMHFDRACNCTQAVLLGDYFKSILTGIDLPADLERVARDSRFYRQYDPDRPLWLRDAAALPATDLTNAFVRE